MEVFPDSQAVPLFISETANQVVPYLDALAPNPDGVVLLRAVSWGAAAVGIAFLGIGLLTERNKNTTPIAFNKLRSASIQLKILGGIFVLISILLFLGGWKDPVTLGWNLGAVTVVGFALSGWMAVGTLLYGVEFPKKPLLLLSIPLGIFIFSGFNDNHAVRTLPPPRTTDLKNPAENNPGGLAKAADTRTGFIEAFDAWHAANKSVPGTPPIVVVATAGGGIRAAYWTASILGYLQDLYPEFDNRLFAISGVSGGSLGAVVYRTLLLATTTDHEGKKKPNCETSSFKDCSQKILSRDFLSPAILSLLYPDMVQRFLPYPLLPDRATALELAWERSWEETIRKGGTDLSMPFEGLWTGGKNAWPILFLNGASANTGGRIITSTVRLDEGTFPLAKDFVAEARGGIRISTAANNSARFPYVGPSGTVEYKLNKSSENRRDSIVDGGYFDNFGAQTAMDVIEGIRIHAKRLKENGEKPPKLIVIQITNDPLFVSDLRSKQDRLNKEDESCKKDLPKANDVASPGQLTAPIAAMIAAWSARAYQNAILLKRMTEEAGGTYVHFRVMRNEHKENDPPLGWTLSVDAQASLKRQVDKCQKPKLDNLVNYLRSLEARRTAHLSDLPR